MDNTFCINKSGLVVPVYSYNSSTGSLDEIGKIYNREAFALLGYEGDSHYIKFLNSDGEFVDGMLQNPPDDAVVGCHFYPYGQHTEGITTYITFVMRNEANVYNAAGDYWGKVAAGKRVACLTSLAGDEHPEWKAINLVEPSSGGDVWTPVTGAGKNYGFVDTGLRSGSSYSKINMYGSW